MSTYECCKTGNITNKLKKTLLVALCLSTQNAALLHTDPMFTMVSHYKTNLNVLLAAFVSFPVFQYHSAAYRMHSCFRRL